MFGFLPWVVFGLIVGALWKFIRPAEDPGGFLPNLASGVFGAITGGWLATVLGWGTKSSEEWTAAVLGAIVFVGAYRFIVNPKPLHPDREILSERNRQR
jgi:uncharacterized membrane protein YeaQ/YmgE (transglycosylase-associated protein family)